MSTATTGYRKRPWEFTLLAIGFALVPLVSWLSWYFPYFLAGRPETPFDVLAMYFGTATHGAIGLGHAVLMGALWAMFLAVAWGIWRVTSWGFVLCIVVAIANSLFSTVTYSVGDSGTVVKEYLGFNPWQWGVLFNLVFFVPVIVLLRQKLMAPFFNPKLKWWEQHPRVKAHLHIEATLDGEKKTYQSFDISASGMFLGTPELPAVTIGEHFPAAIHLEDTGTVVRVSCEVVWISAGGGRAPRGLGVTFRYFLKIDRLALRRYIDRQIKDGHRLERT